MSEIGFPLSSKPSDYSSIGAAIDYIIGRHDLNFECCLPAIVESFDRVNNHASVRPLIMVTSLDPNGGKPIIIRRHLLTELPVMSFGGGGFHISFPLKAGDIGWIFAADRDIQNFISTLQECAATTSITHKFVQGVFVPEVFRKYTINSEDADAFVLQSTDNASRISIRSDNIKITTPEDLSMAQALLSLPEYQIV